MSQFTNRKLASQAETLQIASDLKGLGATVCRYREKIDVYHGDDMILRASKAGFGFVLLFTDRVVMRNENASTQLTA